MESAFWGERYVKRSQNLNRSLVSADRHEIIGDLQPFLCDVDGLHSLKISAWK
jgi:hypothetical protein